MDLIRNGTVLERHLLRCLADYERFAFASAWASSGTMVLKKIIRLKHRLHRGVVGTHFYQTHPDVLKAFVNSRDVRFMLQPSGVFHPKVFVFWGKAGWEAFVGSANLTHGAFSRNSEVILRIGQGDAGAEPIRSKLIETIGAYWKDAKTVSPEQARAYRDAWKLRAPSRDRLADRYGGAKTRRPALDSVMAMPWPAYFGALEDKGNEDLRQRCDLLDKARRAFEASPSFGEMDPGRRLMVAGLKTDADDHWGWFGSMIGAGKYYRAVNGNDPHLSRALDHIPMDGDVPRRSYDAYLRAYRGAFPQGRDGIATATRLLALKRPDQFVCVDGKNRSRLCRNLGVLASGLSYQRYWDEIVLRIRDSVWWNAPPPAKGLELSAWKGRAALLDALFYEH